jgi:ribosomal protein S18 acetylase RimI-like enzyme
MHAPPIAGLQIRSGTENDIEPVRELLGRVYAATYAPLIGAARAQALHERWHSRDALLAELSAPHSSFLIAADSERVLVGHALASAQRLPILAVVRLYVAVTHQRRGVGRRPELLARHPRAESVRLYVLEGNAGALAFYRRQGFSIVGEGEEDGVRSLRLERSAA